MFAGHIGAALAIGRAERRINLGALVFAALLLDVLLWIFVLLGWEAVTIPANFATTHQPCFIFPYSHGLLASVALAVFSHWFFDTLVHVPELPLAGEGSLKVGLGLWGNMPVALAAEALITVAGLCLFRTAMHLSRARKFWLTALSLSLLAFTVLGMTVASPPPSAAAMAASSLVAIVVICALAGWLGKGAI